MIALKLEPTTECIELLEEKDVSGIERVVGAFANKVSNELE